MAHGGASTRPSRLSSTGPSAGLLCVRKIVRAPVELWIAAVASVSATTGRPCSSQIRPVSS